MNIEALIERVGSGFALAELLGVTPGAVSHWRVAGVIPPMRQWQIRGLLPDFCADSPIPEIPPPRVRPVRKARAQPRPKTPSQALGVYANTAQNPQNPAIGLKE